MQQLDTLNTATRKSEQEEPYGGTKKQKKNDYLVLEQTICPLHSVVPVVGLPQDGNSNNGSCPVRSSLRGRKRGKFKQRKKKINSAFESI